MSDITIYEIAKLADVSPSTVSRVINHKENVNAATKERVEKILREHNFVVNEAARGLVMKQSRMIGILISDLRTTQHTSGVYYMERELTAKGYTCLILNTGRNPEEQKVSIERLSRRNVDAAILMGSVYQNDEVRTAIETYLPRTPVILFNGEMESPLVYCIVSDERNGVKKAAEMLRERGRKNIAFIVDYDTPSNRMKIQGYHDGMEGEGVVGWTDGSQLGGYSATLKLIKEHPETDAIIYSEDNLAVSGLRALYEEGRTVPGDVALVGLNNSAFSELSFLPLSSIDNMLYRQSRMAVKNLELILAGQKVPKHIMIETEFVERRTT